MLTCIASLACALAAQNVADFPSSASSFSITHVLVVPPVGRGGRVPFSTDAIQHQIVFGDWKTPVVGDTVEAPDGSKKVWAEATADKDGWFKGDAFGGGYAFCQVNSNSDRVVILHANGDSLVYVNGQIRTGDPYGNGYVELPIELGKGTNDFLFLTGRGQLKIDLAAPVSSLLINAGDATLPDAIAGQAMRGQRGAVVLENASTQPATGFHLTARIGDKTKTTDCRVTIPPLSTYKVPIELPEGTWSDAGDLQLQVGVSIGDKPEAGTQTFKYRVRTPKQTRKETYLSSVDDSVQYYAVVPPPDPKPGLAMILSLHGASVEATSQADAYSPKDWAWIACATNRRPFGFDWEDWGRTDGMDVLAIAKKEFQTDPVQTYVTGHSMGGHGTWQFGALFPNRFAAIGVSAGWSSFFSYVGVSRSTTPSPMVDIFQRANGSSASLDMKENYKSEGVYILHGDADDNVPVDEARQMRKILEPLTKDLGYHEQKGAGHWWDGPAAPGADCLEWPEMMDFIKGHRLSQPASIDFTTANLAVNNWDAGVTILQQTHPLSPSRIQMADGSATTSNIDRFAVDAHWRNLKQIDGQAVSGSESGCYSKTDGKWHPDSPHGTSQIGPFKQAVNNHTVLVYGTSGNADENAWSFGKARYDAEAFWYRGNGALQVISDRDYLSGRFKNRDAIFYGNADTNAGWKSALGASSIQLKRDSADVGSHHFAGTNLSAVFCWRKPGSKTLFGAVGGTGLSGMRLTERVPYFTSGVGFPDWTLMTPETLVHGIDGVIGAGYYAPDGSVDTGDQAWEQTKPAGIIRS
jgi:dienelactone hydrolase